MDRLGKRKRDNLTLTSLNIKKIALDSVILIYYFEDILSYADKIESIFNDIESGKKIGLISAIAIHEILVKPKQNDDIQLVAKYKDELTSFPNLYIFPVTIEVAEKASELRAKYSSLKAPDALQIATAIEAGADIFLTADKKLKQIQEIDIFVL